MRPVLQRRRPAAARRLVRSSLRLLHAVARRRRRQLRLLRPRRRLPLLRRRRRLQSGPRRRRRRRRRRRLSVYVLRQPVPVPTALGMSRGSGWSRLPPMSTALLAVARSSSRRTGRLQRGGTSTRLPLWQLHQEDCPRATSFSGHREFERVNLTVLAALIEIGVRWFLVIMWKENLPRSLRCGL